MVLAPDSELAGGPAWVSDEELVVDRVPAPVRVGGPDLVEVLGLVLVLALVVVFFEPSVAPSAPVRSRAALRTIAITASKLRVCERS